MKHLFNFVLTLVLVFGSAFAHGQTHTIPSLEGGPWIWDGVSVFDYGNLQLNSAPPSCPVGEYVLGLSETFTPHCGIPGGAAAFQTAVYPAVCQASGTIPSWCGASGQTADTYIRAACSQLPSTGGTINLLNLTGIIAASVPCSTPSKQVITLQDPTSTLTITEADGGVVFPQDQGSLFLGPGNIGQGAANRGIKLSSSANVTAIVGPAHTDGTQENFSANGLSLYGAAGATVSQALIYTNDTFANTTFDGNNVFVCNTACIKVLNSDDVEIANNWLNVSDGVNSITGVPLIIQGAGLGTGCNVGMVNVRGGQMEHALGGGPEIQVIGDGAGALACSISIRDVGIERNSAGTPSTIGIKISDCQSCEVQNIVTTGAGGGSDLINISQTANGRIQNVILTNIDNVFASYTNTLNDTTTTGLVLNSFSNPRITTYYSSPGYVQPPVLPGTTIQSLSADFTGGLGSFSTGSGTLPTGFGMTGCLLSQGLTCTYTRTNSTAPPGFTYSQQMQISANTGGSSGYNGLQYGTGFAFTANQSYVASFYAKGDGTFTGIPTFLLWNSLTGTVACQFSASAAFPTTWTLYSFPCKPTTSGTLNLSITALTPIGATGTFWLGDFVYSTVQPLTQGNFVGAISPYGVGTSVNGASISVGSGAPTATCGTAPTGNGSLYLRTDGSTGTSVYKCEAGTWVAE